MSDSPLTPRPVELSEAVKAKTVWACEYEINSLLINTQGRIGLYALLNLLQDVGWSHAHTLGHGHVDTAGRKAMWVLTRQRVRMDEWPTWGKNLKIETWLRPTTGAFVSRDFRIYCEGKVIGEATSSFLLLNNETRKPMREDLSKLGFPMRASQHVSFDAEKVLPQTEVKNLTSFEVRNSDIDLNNHVNNTRYAQWVLDAIPFATHAQFLLKEYEVNFIAETKSGDVVHIQEALANHSFNSGVHSGAVFFQGVRANDAKVAFTVRMQIEEASS